MENQVDVQPESSPVTLEVPRDGAAYTEWRQTGKLPEAKPAPPKGDSAPPKESSAEGEKPKEKAAPVSETGKQDQEKQKPPRNNAATRLNELLEDLGKAGLTPAELKTFKREAQKAAEQVEQPKAAPEKTENPTELKPPTKPKAEDFKLTRTNYLFYCMQGSVDKCAGILDRVYLCNADGPSTYSPCLPQSCDMAGSRMICPTCSRPIPQALVDAECRRQGGLVARG